jgi:hypothetical protein
MAVTLPNGPRISCGDLPALRISYVPDRSARQLHALVRQRAGTVDTALALLYVDVRVCSRGGPHAALRAARNGEMYAYI